MLLQIFPSELFEETLGFPALRPFDNTANAPTGDRRISSLLPRIRHLPTHLLLLSVQVVLICRFGRIFAPALPPLWLPTGVDHGQLTLFVRVLHFPRSRFTLDFTCWLRSHNTTFTGCPHQYDAPLYRAGSFFPLSCAAISRKLPLIEDVTFHV